MRKGLVGLIIGALALMIYWTAHSVPTGHVAIVYSFGGIAGQRDEGLGWVAPWQSVRYALIQVEGHKFPKLVSFSNETQEVYVDATMNIRVSPEKIQELYRNVGPDYFNILVRPRVLQAFKDEMVKYSSVEVAPNREAIRKAVRARLALELETRSIVVDDLLLDNISFSKTFQDAIEEKQANTQLALSEREKIAVRRAEADQAIEKARGEGQAILDVADKQAEANQKLAKSITPEFVQYLFAAKLAPNVSVMILPSGQPFIMGPEMLKTPTRSAAQQ